MKINTCLTLLSLCVISTVMGQDTVSTDGSTILVSNEETGTNPDGSINWKFYARAAGRLFVGTMSGTQRDITMTDTQCYAYAVVFDDELVNQLFKNGLDFAVIINRVQVAQVKLQAAFEACGIDTMIEQLDKRMSNLDYTLALISNVMAQAMSGFES